MSKLHHLLGYLHGTRNQVLTINKPRGNQLLMYVDAAYAFHEKGESHLGFSKYSVIVLCLVISYN
jgi:hypothetical protein